jgi:hypothetical protein
MKKYTAADYVFQFITVTAGVLIALLIDGVVQSNSDRELVASAHAAIAREVADNLKEIGGLPQSIASSNADIDKGLNLANDLLSKGKTEISSLQLNFNLATLIDSSWVSADRTGALAHMSYEDVKDYAELYELQELFDNQQRKAIDLVGESIAMISGAFDPTKANRDDLARFRDGLMRLRANLVVTEDLGEQLTKAYREFQPK